MLVAFVIPKTAAVGLLPQALVFGALVLYVLVVLHRVKGQDRRDRQIARSTRGEVPGFEKPRDESDLL